MPPQIPIYLLFIYLFIYLFVYLLLSCQMMSKNGRVEGEAANNCKFKKYICKILF